MDNILIVLTLFCFAKTLLMTGLFPGRWYGIGFGLLCAAFVVLSHPYALQQNKLSLEHAMEGRQMLTDVSLAVMADLLLTLAFGRAVLRRMAGYKLTKRENLFCYLPSMLIFPALYYIHLNLFFTFVGTDFAVLTAFLSAGAFAAVAGGSAGLKLLLPETDLRLELTLLTGFLIFILIVCCTVFHPSSVMYSHAGPIDWKNLLFTFLTVAVLLAAGYFRPYIRKLFKLKNIKNR